MRLGALEKLLNEELSIDSPVLLETAVGVGAYGPLWRRLGITEWTGIDISETAISDLSHLLPDGQFLVRDLTIKGLAASLPERSYDLVTAIDVIFHIVDDRRFRVALENLGTCVRPGGYLVASDVFVARSRQTAPHVRHRSLDDWTRGLPSNFTLVSRQQCSPSSMTQCLAKGFT